MPGIRAVNIVFVVSLLTISALLAAILFSTTYEAALDQTERSMQQGIDDTSAAGEAGVEIITEKLMNKTLAALQADIGAALTPVRLWLAGMIAFVGEFPAEENEKWEWSSERLRPFLWSSFELLSNRHEGLVTNMRYLNLGGDAKGGAAGYLTGQRDTGPHYLSYYEPKETIHRPTGPDHYHFLAVVENDGKMSPDWWEDQVWKRPGEGWVLVDGDKLDGAWKQEEGAGGDEEASAEADDCVDELPDTPACKYGGYCECADLTCGSELSGPTGSMAVDDLCQKTCHVCGCADELPSSPACKYGGMCDCADLACGTELSGPAGSMPVDDLCQKTCVCDGPPPPPPCADELPSSPACKYGGMCDCAEQACDAVVNGPGGHSMVMSELCACTCAAGGGANVTAGAAPPPPPGVRWGCLPFGVVGSGGEIMRHAPDDDHPCDQGASVAAGKDVPLGNGCCLPAVGIGWTVWMGEIPTIMRDPFPIGKPLWLGLAGMGGQAVSLKMAGSYYGRFDDPVYGRRGGLFSLGVSVTVLSSFFAPEQQRNLPQGYRMYMVTRGWAPERQVVSGEEPPAPRPIHTDMLVAVSQGEVFNILGYNENELGKTALLDTRHCTNATDPVIRASAQYLLSLGDVRTGEGTDGEREGFDAIPANELRTWLHDGATYFQRILKIMDHGLDMRVVLLLPRSAIMRDIDEAQRLTKARVADDKRGTQDDVDRGLVITVCVLVGVAALLSVASIAATVQATRPLIVLERGMATVAAMQLEDVDTSQPFSVFTEVSRMQTSFLSMHRDIMKWRDDERQRRYQLELDREMRIQRSVDTAIANSKALVHPMVLIRARDFLKLKGLTSYENLRDQGLLIVLDTEQALQRFQETNVTVFLSHQWLDWGWPDPEGIHHGAMVAAVEKVAKILKSKRGHSEIDLDDELHVWVDFGSIAQEHRGMQALAVQSLPVYSSAADAFVVVVPSATHKKTGARCNADSYGLRGWCRAEMLAKVCGSGFTHMYIAESSDQPLSPFTAAWLDRLSLKVFEGEFSCCAIGHRGSQTCDMESLVLPVLGLYNLMLRQHDAEHIAPILKFVEGTKRSFFPEKFTFQHCDGWEEDRELFGSLVTALEERVRQDSGYPNSPSSSLGRRSPANRAGRRESRAFAGGRPASSPGTRARPPSTHGRSSGHAASSEGVPLVSKRKSKVSAPGDYAQVVPVCPLNPPAPRVPCEQQS